jgi:CheY-like chemotaxis protein
MMEAQALQEGVLLTFPQSDEPRFVWADQTRLKQVVINILSNAIKYNKKKGSVIVTCTDLDKGRVRIGFRDTGDGLEPEKLAQLFQPFNRLGQEASGIAGTGIGLVVTKQLTELMEGTLGVESTPGIGSIFWVELRSTAAPDLIVKAAELAASFPPQPKAGKTHHTLLYIEDNTANMKLVEQLIALRSDIVLFTAINGTLGIELARSIQPDVILMDINLPGISGVEALQILQADSSTSHIPVVALSANAMLRDIELGIQAGFFRYLTKPIRVKEFMDTLNVALAFNQENM